MSLITRRTTLAAVAALAAPAVRAQEAWPTRPVRIVVPFAAGGSTDILARVLSQPLSARLGQPVVVENRGGAGGTIGADAVAKATDGHTLLMAAIGTASINYALYRANITYKPEDLAAVSQVAVVPNVIFATNNLLARSLQELAALAKSRREGLTMGSPGSGTSNHLTGELFREAAGIEIVHVPFRGAGPMLTEIIAGRVDFAVDNLPSALGHIRDGRLRGLAVTSPQRSAALPDVPTTREAGFPQVDAEAWFGIQAPSRMPRAHIDKASAEIRAVLADPAVRARIEEQGGRPIGDTPDEFEALIRREIARWDAVVRRANVTAD